MSSLPVGSASHAESATAPLDTRASRRFAITLAPQRLWRVGLGLVLGLLLPAGLLGLWVLAVHETWFAEQILPAPQLVFATALELLRSGQLQDELGVSCLRLVLGLLLGGSAGLACGIALGASRRLDIYFGPAVRAIWLVPSLGWLPFFMLAFGIGEELKILLIAKTCFLPLMINSYDAMRNLPRKYRDVARVLELDRLTTLRLVLVPAMLPALFNGFRMALTKGCKALILVEMVASAAGIGYLMTWGRKAFQLDVVLVTMVVIGLAGWLLDYGSLVLQRRCTRWAEHTTS